MKRGTMTKANYVKATLEVEHLKDQLQKALAEVREIQAAQMDMLNKLQGIYQINMRVLNLIKAPPSKAGVQRHETGFVDRFAR